MPDITISPIPYNSGTVSTTLNTTHMCYIDNGLYVHAFAQTNPNYVVLYTTTHSNYNKSTAAIVRTGTARAIYLPSTPTNVRLFRISSKHFLIFMMTGITSPTFYLGEINSADGSITAESVTLPYAPVSAYYSSSASGFDGTFNYEFSNAPGSTIQFFNPYENVIYVLERFYSSANIRFSRLNFDPATKTWTLMGGSSTNITVNAGPTYAGAFSRVYCQDIPGSTSKLISIRSKSTGESNNLLSSNIVWASIVSETGVTKNIINANRGYQALCPLSETNILGFSSHGVYYAYNGTAWSNSTVTFAGGSPRYIIDVVALNSTTFLTLSVGVDIQTNSQLSGSNVQAGRIQIARVVDSTFAQTNTQTLNGSSISASYVYMDQQILNRTSSDTIQIMCRDSSSTTLGRATIIHQPGA